MAALTPVKVYLGIPALSVNTAYTVPSGKKLIAKCIRLSNNTSINATITIITETATAGAQTLYFANALTVKANDLVVIELNEVLEAGEKIKMQQGTGNAITVQISGIEVTV